MKLFINYSKDDKPSLPALGFLLKNLGHQAVATASDFSLAELLAKAKAQGCHAILLINEVTLRGCVPGNTATLDQWRGTRLNTSIPILVLNKMAHLHTVPHGRWLMEMDLKKLSKIHVPAQTFRFKVLEDKADFALCLTLLEQAICIAYDIETKTFELTKAQEELRHSGVPMESKPTIITCASWTGIFPYGLRTFVLPLVDWGIDHWQKDHEYEAALRLLRDVNALPVPKVMHNGMYDSTHSIVYGAPPLNWSLDTMALHHAEFSELPKDLGFVASYHLYDYIQWKTQSEQASKNKDIREYWGYNGKDTWYTARVLISQLRNSPAYARKNYGQKFHLVYPALYSNFEGIKIDSEIRARVRKEQVAINERALGRLRTVFADPSFNPGSWQQVSHYLYKVFGAKNPKIGKSNSGTDEKNLLAVAEQHPILERITSQILDYRGSQKAIGTYLDFIQRNGRLLYAINPFGTESERMAANASSFWCGTQIQNIPLYAKEYLMADDGCELVEVDNSQSEARCTAYLAQELDLIAALENVEKDFYKTLGTLFLGIPYEEVTDFFRNKVLKKIVHGTNYMMGPGTFIVNIGVAVLYLAAARLGIKIVEIPRSGAKDEVTLKGFAGQLLDAYHVPFKRVRQWYGEIKAEVSTTGMLVSPLGHTRRFFGDITKNHAVFRSSVAHQPQNLSVHILNIGYGRAYKEIVLPSQGEFRLKAQIHDSVLAQYPKEKRAFYIGELLRVMDNPVVVHGRTLRIPLEAKFGTHWGNMQKWKGQ